MKNAVAFAMILIMTMIYSAKLMKSYFNQNQEVNFAKFGLALRIQVTRLTMQFLILIAFG